MRVLGVGHHNDLGDLYLALVARGHEVRVHIADADSADVMQGMLERAASYDEGLAWVRAAGADGVVVFEGAEWGEAQDELRRAGLRVVGGSALGDRLEKDRAFGQKKLAELGLSIARSWQLSGFEDAIRFIRAEPRRYVLKYSGPGYASTRGYVGARPDGLDVIAVLQQHAAAWAHEPPELIVMEHVEGVEIGVGAFFDGARFLGPPNFDVEHKRFFPGDLGELTGEMGTLVSYRDAERLFDATLARAAPMLAASGYVGYVNLNTIVNSGGVWPLELTCRFGYPGFAVLSALHADPWDTILLRMLERRSGDIATFDGYAIGIVLTVPPFPYPDGYARLSKGMSILIDPQLSDDERQDIHFGEVKMEGGRLVTSGQIGYAMVVTGRGATVEQAQGRARALAERIVIPNARYRTDIGDRFVARDHHELRRLGWLP